MLVAVELALESTRQGRVSVEHVFNVLSRLNAVSAPESAATALQVLTPPLANTERYDSLRGGTITTVLKPATRRMFVNTSCG